MQVQVVGKLSAYTSIPVFEGLDLKSFMYLLYFQFKYDTLQKSVIF